MRVDLRSPAWFRGFHGVAAPHSATSLAPAGLCDVQRLGWRLHQQPYGSCHSGVGARQSARTQLTPHGCPGRPWRCQGLTIPVSRLRRRPPRFPVANIGLPGKTTAAGPASSAPPIRHTRQSCSGPCFTPYTTIDFQFFTRCSPSARKRLGGERRVARAAGSHHRCAQDAKIRCPCEKPQRPPHSSLAVAHPRSAVGVGGNAGRTTAAVPPESARGKVPLFHLLCQTQSPATRSAWDRGNPAHRIAQRVRTSGSRSGSCPRGKPDV